MLTYLKATCPTTKRSWDVHATIDLWQHKKRLGPERWHTLENGGGTSRGEARTTSFEMVWTYPTEAPVRSGVIRRFGNEKRGGGWPNLTWEKSVKRDLKDWCITKELALDRREWKLAIHVPEPWSSVLSFLLSSVSFFLLLLVFFCLAFYCLFSFCRISFFIVLHFPHSFSTLFYSCFFGSCDFISSLPQLAWD
jgi:hypothetical protein